jgi:sulfite exporter TauE/SafE
VTLGAAAVLGLVGSLHCVAMCGPLALVVCGAHGTASERLRRAGLYHSGRTVMYALLGAAAGLAGHASALAGAGRVLTVAAGVSLVAGAVAPRLLGGRVPLSGALMPVAARAAGAAVQVRRRFPWAGTFALGMANGLLPCGMLYSALLLALTAAGPVQSAVTMSVFGAATALALVATTLAAGAVPITSRPRLVALTPVAVAGVGVLLVVRGLTTSCH